MACSNEWDNPITEEDIEAIDAAICSKVGTLLVPATPSPDESSFNDCEEKVCKRLRILPPSLTAHAIHTSNRSSLSQGEMKTYPIFNFRGCIKYCRSTSGVKKAVTEISGIIAANKRKNNPSIFGFDIEWRPTFTKGIPQGKAAVMQICGGPDCCYVMHIFHSGIPENLKSLLEDPTLIKVGVGIFNDSVKIFKDYNVSIIGLEDLSSIANYKFGGHPKTWSLASLTEALICKQLLKPRKIRLGNWETCVLSRDQLQYAANDAYASWYVYQVLNAFPDPTSPMNVSEIIKP